jgi:hypothetical protein
MNDYHTALLLSAVLIFAAYLVADNIRGTRK